PADGIASGAQSLRRRRAGGHRQHPRGPAGRIPPGADRSFRRRLFSPRLPIPRWGGLRDPHCRPAGQALGPVGLSCDGEGLNPSPQLPLAAPSRWAWGRSLRANAFLLLLVGLWWLGPHLNDQNKDDPFASYANVVLLVGINIILATSLQLINGLSGQFSLGHAGFMALGAYVAGYATEACSIDPAGGPYSDRFVNPGGVALFCVALTCCLLALGLMLWGVYALLRACARG